MCVCVCVCVCLSHMRSNCFPFIQDGVLTRELVQNGLSELGRTGDGTKMSYLSLSLSVSWTTPNQ